MADKMRWRYGDTNPVVAAVDPATVIEIGDLLWQDVDDAKPASLFAAGEFPGQLPLETPAARLSALQRSFSEMFLGVAMQRRRVGEIDPIRVATTGVFELDCPDGSFELGDLVGADQDAAGSLPNQRVAKVADPRSAIARVAKRQPNAVSTVLVDICSTVMTGGILPR